MVEEVGNVVVVEGGGHGHRFEGQFADLTACCCGGFARHHRAEEHAKVPVEGLGHEGDSGAATKAAISCPSLSSLADHSAGLSNDRVKGVVERFLGMPDEIQTRGPSW